MIGPILSALAVAEVKHRARRAARRAALTAVAGVLGAVALGFVVVAAYVALLPHLGPIGTPLAAAGLFAVVALVVLAVRGFGRHRRSIPAAETAAFGVAAGSSGGPSRGGGLMPSGRAVLLVPAAVFLGALVAGRLSGRR